MLVNWNPSTVIAWTKTVETFFNYPLLSLAEDKCLQAKNYLSVIKWLQNFTFWVNLLFRVLWHPKTDNSGIQHMKSSFPKRYKSILIVFMKMTFFYLDPYILLIFTITPSESRTRVSGAGGGRSNKERQSLQLLASVARSPLCEVRRVRYILNKEI